MTSVIANYPSAPTKAECWHLSFTANDKTRFPYQVSLAMWLHHEEALKLQEKFMNRQITYHIYDTNNNFVNIHDVSGNYSIEEVHSLFEHLF